jgi:dTDP-4-dehydrorhamnose 3,5-epimerase
MFYAESINLWEVVMGQFKIIQTQIDGVYIIEHKIFTDNRGFFTEIYNHMDFENHGLSIGFVQDNISVSKKGVLRGLHFQRNNPQGKLIKVIHGEIFDAAVDLRNESKTYGKWVGVVLSEYEKKELFIPGGFAHGFLVLSEEAEVLYKCTDYYNPTEESGLIWNDPDIGIKWPLDRIDEVILSDKDKKWLGIKSLK